MRKPFSLYNGLFSTLAPAPSNFNSQIRGFLTIFEGTNAVGYFPTKKAWTVPFRLDKQWHWKYGHGVIKELKFTKVAPKVATPNDLAILEAELGAKLPQAFHEFCFRWNGGFPSKENQCYLVPSSFTEFYQKFCFGRKTEGVAIEVTSLLGTTEEYEPCSLIKDYRFMCKGERVYRDWPFIPIGKDLMGGRAVLCADCPLQMVYWIDRDTFEMPDGIEWGTIFGNPEARLALMPIAPNLEMFYNSLTAGPDRDQK